jgi:tetratricopeptide (TPR) repeat protein
VLEEALVISRRTAGTHPIGLHRTLTNLGHLDLANGNAASAETLYREVLALRRAHWGVEHPEVANALINLATAVGRQKRFDEAESLFREGLDMRRRLQGNDHAEVGIDLGGLGEMYHARGDLVRAEATYRDALSLLRRTLGDGHPRSIAAEESLKVVRREAGRRD